MKINITTVLLFALRASTANGYATVETCDELNPPVKTHKDCNTWCTQQTHEAGARTWKGFTRGPMDAITECTCNIPASQQNNGRLPAENVIMCTRERTPEDPVTTVESCEEAEPTPITDWPSCKDHCMALADDRGMRAHVEGGMGNISACKCTYGRQKEHSYTCTRTPTPLPSIAKKTRGMGCSRSDISNQHDCFSFCLGYQCSEENRCFPKAVSNADGLFRCLCLDGEGGDANWDCEVKPDSYLRSG